MPTEKSLSNRIAVSNKTAVNSINKEKRFKNIQ